MKKALAAVIDMVPMPLKVKFGTERAAWSMNLVINICHSSRILNTISPERQPLKPGFRSDLLISGAGERTWYLLAPVEVPELV